jgi:hypothetical protein
MELQIPTVPIVIVTLLGIFAPYAIAVVNQPWWKPAQKKIVAIVLSLLLTAIALLIYFAATGEPVPQWWTLLLLGLFVAQASYSLIAKDLGAAALERATSLPDAIVTYDDHPPRH